MTLPSDILVSPERFSVRRNGTEVILSPSEFLIFGYIAGARDGIRPASIYNIHYDIRADRGPNTGYRVIHQFRVHINRRIAKLKLKIVGTTPSASVAYELKDQSNG